MKICLVASVARNLVIGHSGRLPWRLPKDMAYFKETTLGAVLIMGRQTYESLPDRFRPLQSRYSILLSRNRSYQPTDLPPKVGEVVRSFAEAYDTAKKVAEEGDWRKEVVFVIGGSQVYKQAIPHADQLLLTEVDTEAGGDTFFPDYKNSWQKISYSQLYPADEQHSYAFRFVCYERRAN